MLTHTEKQTNVLTVNTTLPLATSEVNHKQLPNILVVDDDEMSRFLFPALLSKLGYGCKTAKDGKEALHMVISEPVDIIFMDLYMPMMNGLETTKKIREELKNSSKPIIIALTANALDEKEKCIAAGMNDFMSKPYRLVNMQKMLDNWINIIN